MPDITEISVVDLLPASIRQDESVVAAAQAIDSELNAVSQLCMVPALLARIDELSSNTLDHLAWQFDSKVWRESWPVYLKRSVIKTVILEKSKKGTRSSLENALVSMGSAAVVTEWFEKTPAADPYTFDVTLSLADVEGQASSEVQEDLIRKIEDVKPARCHYTLTLATEAVGNMYMTAVGRAAVYSRISGQEQ